MAVPISVQPTTGIHPSTFGVYQHHILTDNFLVSLHVEIFTIHGSAILSNHYEVSMLVSRTSNINKLQLLKTHIASKTTKELLSSVSHVGVKT